MTTTATTYEDRYADEQLTRTAATAALRQFVAEVAPLLGAGWEQMPPPKETYRPTSELRQGDAVLCFQRDNGRIVINGELLKRPLQSRRLRRPQELRDPSPYQPASRRQLWRAPSPRRLLPGTTSAYWHGLRRARSRPTPTR